MPKVIEAGMLLPPLGAFLFWSQKFSIPTIDDALPHCVVAAAAEDPHRAD